jgi:hypothetical protein
MGFLIMGAIDYRLGKNISYLMEAGYRRFATGDLFDEDENLAMNYGYENGFSSGLENDARMFGEITASPGGQEWIGRFLVKDPKQSSFLELVPPITR